MNKFYNYIGLKKKAVRRSASSRPISRGDGKNGASLKDDSKDSKDSKSSNKDSKTPKKKVSNSGGTKLLNAGIGVITSVKRVQFNYSETNGTYIPGYLQTPGFIGTLKPTAGFTFGSQRDVREMAARRGWLTLYPEFNDQYRVNKTQQFDYAANIEPFKDLKVDLVGNRIYAENYTENYRV